ncbi:MAG TPA: hypothetical protein VGM82_18980 [Gemmatimonadaceae bacterium]|jgi:hypothetical protein
MRSNEWGVAGATNYLAAVAACAFARTQGRRREEHRVQDTEGSEAEDKAEDDHGKVRRRLEEGRGGVSKFIKKRGTRITSTFAVPLLTYMVGTWWKKL